MMSRMNKIEDLLHKEIANIITRIDSRDIKNTVTITDIKKRNNKDAVVYFTTLQNNHKNVEKKINSLKPMIKHYLSKNVHLKRIPGY